MDFKLHKDAIESRGILYILNDKMLEGLCFGRVANVL